MANHRRGRRVRSGATRAKGASTLVLGLACLAHPLGAGLADEPPDWLVTEAPEHVHVPPPMTKPISRVYDHDETVWPKPAGQARPARTERRLPRKKKFVPAPRLSPEERNAWLPRGAMEHPTLAERGPVLRDSELVKRDGRLVDIQSTHVEPRGDGTFEARFFDRSANTQHIQNLATYDVQGGSVEARYGFLDDIEVGLNISHANPTLFTLPTQPRIFSETLDAALAFTVKHSGVTKDPNWRYAVGVTKSLQDNSSERFSLPDDWFRRDAFFVSTSLDMNDRLRLTGTVQLSETDSSRGAPEQSLWYFGGAVQWLARKGMLFTVEGLLERIEDPKQIGVYLLAGSEQEEIVNASARFDMGSWEVEVNGRRLTTDGFDEFGIGFTRSF